MKTYDGPAEIETKEDDSPLTQADRAAHDCIVAALEQLTPDIPVLSEESEGIPTEERLGWKRFWLVDPLDGTKEFIKKTGQFTVNIALIENGEPTLGVVLAPASDLEYFAARGSGAFKRLGQAEPQPIKISEADKAKLREVIAAAKPKLAKFAKHLPRRITLIKTTGKDEGAAPYTRGTSIVLPRRTASQSAKGLERLFYHELFHIISRGNPRLRDQLYEIIGYKKCGVVSLPGDMMPRRISNPDAPVVEHCIRVLRNDETYWVAPVLFSRTARYDPETGGTFFRYLEFRLMQIDRKTSAAILKDSMPLLLKPDAVEGFFEQIGRNTNYIIHPEETLANNFVHLMTAKQDLKNPEIPENIEQLLLAE